MQIKIDVQSKQSHENRNKKSKHLETIIDQPEST